MDRASFDDRAAAGRKLGHALSRYVHQPDTIVLALPRGGVPVGYEVARALCAPLDVFVVRKLGVPGHQELAMGAVASGGVRILNEDVIGSLCIPMATIDLVTAVEQRELARREAAYRDGRPDPQIAGKTVILVDDGLATGSTMRAAVAAVRQHQPATVVVAVPVASPDVRAEFQALVDDVVCLETPEHFYAVGLWYNNFSQTTDDEVRKLLARAAARPGI